MDRPVLSQKAGEGAAHRKAHNADLFTDPRHFVVSVKSGVIPILPIGPLHILNGGSRGREGEFPLHSGRPGRQPAPEAAQCLA